MKVVSKRYSRLGAADDIVPPARPRDNHDRLIPMINIVFLLLTFFLIAGTLQIGDPSNIRPPEIASDGALEKDNPVLVVSKDGKMSFDDVVVPNATVVGIAKRLIAGKPQATLYIKAAWDTPVSIILPLLQKLRDEGIQSVRMIGIKNVPEN